MAPKGEITRERIVSESERLILGQGFAGTSLSDILAATGLTKGAFFHHFADKDELGRAVLERYAIQDYELFEAWSREADELTDDPLERCLVFFKLFEKFLGRRSEPLGGCVFASYVYEASNFGPGTTEYIRERLLLWQKVYERKFEQLIAARPPRLPVTAEQLAELAVTLVEGGLMMGKAFADGELLIRQSAQLRNYIQLLFAPAA
jgi:TetR/AcrR family transcriptional regulator, transcriptional repressor for nem operon